MEQFQYNWISEEYDFFKINNDKYTICFKWNKSVYDDFIMLSESFFENANAIAYEILSSSRDNVKYDCWFLSAMFMYRQGLELLIKGILFNYCNNKQEFISFITDSKHNLNSLLLIIEKRGGLKNLSGEEIYWLLKYIKNLENVDANSDLFRFPHRDTFFKDYKDMFLNVLDMCKRIEMCYSILYKTIIGDYDNNKYIDCIDINMSDDFLCFADHGIGNCMLYDSPWEDGFFKQVEGYKECAIFLYRQNKIKNHWDFLPIAYLLRLSIELTLKRFFYSNTEFKIADDMQNKRKSHELKVLLKCCNDLIMHYIGETSQDVEDYNVAKSKILSLSSIDKHGDVFRYPCTYGLEHKLTAKIDYDNVFKIMLGLFNFFDSVDTMLKNCQEIEMEIRSNYT